MTTIQKLPAEVRSYLRSGVTVTSVTQCVEELLLNSLDAGATCVAVRVDLECFKIQVVDNGSGIPQEQLKMIAERYATSKCHAVSDLDNLSYFGYRGEALASIRESCSVLEITSRTKDSVKTYSKLFQDGEPLNMIESTIPRPSVGTTVTVHDLFSNFPVRRKATNSSLELERIRQRVEALALLRPSVSVTLRNDSTGVVLIQTHKCSNSLLTFRHLFGASKASILSEVNGSKSYFTVNGYLGKEGHSKKELQFIYVNGRLVLKTKIHKLVNKMLTNSAIFKRKYGSDDITSSIENRSVFVKSPGRQIERYPVFILNILCPLIKYDITFDPAKTLIEFSDWDTLLELTTEILNSFLKKENLIYKEEKVCETNGEKLTHENTGPNNMEKSEKKTLCNIISPSNLRDTLFSKQVKRKSATEVNQYKTPVSISIEEWKAKNKIRRKVLDDTQTSSSTCSSSSDSAAVQVNQNSTVEENENSSIDNQRKLIVSEETTESSDKITELNSNQLTHRKTIKNRDKLSVINEKGDNNTCMRVLELQKLQNKAVHDDTQEISADKTIQRECLGSNTLSERKTADVSLAPRSSLSEFRKQIGKPVSGLNNDVGVDEKLKENFEHKLSHKTAQEVKYTSSLQKFKKQFVTTEPEPVKQKIEMLHEETEQTLPKHVSFEDQVFNSKHSDTLGKSRISVTDSRMNNKCSSDVFNSIQNIVSNRNCLHQDYWNLSSDTNLPEIRYGPSYCARYDVRDYAPAPYCLYNTKLNRIQEKNYHSSTSSRKRLHSGIDTETVAYKLSKLSKQRTATISLTGMCGSSRSPHDAGITCGDNAVVTVISEKTILPPQKSVRPPPCAAITSSSSNLDFSFHPVTETEVSDLDNGVSVISCDCDKNERELSQSGNLYENIVNLPLNSDANADELITNDHHTASTNDAMLYNQDDANYSADSARFIAVKSDERPLNLASCVFKDNACLLRSGRENIILDKMDYKQNTDKEYQQIETQSEEVNQGPANHKEILDHIEHLSSTETNTNSQPFDFSTQRFSPCLNGSQTGLSQKMTYVSIQEQQQVTPEMLTPSAGVSPCSLGFSPCMSISPASLHGNESSDSQGFATENHVMPENQPDFSSGEGKEKKYASVIPETEDIVAQNSLENSLDKTTGIQFEQDHIPSRPDSAENCKTEEDSQTISGTESENISLQHTDILCKSKQVSNAEDEPDSNDQSQSTQLFDNTREAVEKKESIEQFKSQAHIQTVLNSESERTSEEIIFTNNTVRISQMLLRASQNKHIKSSVDTTQCSPNIEFNDIFPPSGTDGIQRTTVMTEDSESQENVTEIIESIKEAEENHLETDDIDKQPEIAAGPANSDSDDDTLLQPTPDNSDWFSSWDCSVVNTKVIKESDKTDENFNSTKQKSNNGGQVPERVIENSKTENVSYQTVSDSQVTVTGEASGKIVSSIAMNEDTRKTNSNLSKDSSDKAKTDTHERKWIQMKDPQTGKKIYVHSLLGTTITEDKWRASYREDEPGIDNPAADSGTNNTGDKTDLPVRINSTTERLNNFVANYTTTGGKTTDEDDEEDAFVKWRDAHTPDPVSGPASVEELLAEWTNPVFESTDKDVINTELSALPKGAVKAYRALHTCRFTKEMLNTVKVIGQVDKKFIACLMKIVPAKSSKPDMLSVIDQHAAHERIRLEMLTEESYVDCDVDSGKLQQYKVDPQYCMELTGDEVRIMTSFTEEFNRIGIQFHPDRQSRTKIYIETIPACIMEKDVNYVKSMRENVAWNIIKALIKEHVDLLVSTGGAGKKLPTVIHKALCSQACHGAIKFGDNLTLRECEALIRDLSRCDLPFQCAHGRPSVMPVLQLDQLRTKLPSEERRKPQLYKLSNAIQKEQT